MSILLDRNGISRWFRGWLKGGPHLVVGPANDPNLLRWYVLPRNRLFNIYLHKWLRDDENRAMHDHPWWFVSIILWGGYSEVTPNGINRRRPLSMIARPATDPHRVVLHRTGPVSNLPIHCWTIFITGPRRRNWGFHCPKGWVPWQEFTKPNRPGEIGRGCGEH